MVVVVDASKQSFALSWSDLKYRFRNSIHLFASIFLQQCRAWSATYFIYISEENKSNNKKLCAFFSFIWKINTNCVIRWTKKMFFFTLSTIESRDKWPWFLHGIVIGVIAVLIQIFDRNRALLAFWYEPLKLNAHKSTYEMVFIHAPSRKTNAIKSDKIVCWWNGLGFLFRPLWLNQLSFSGCAVVVAIYACHMIKSLRILPKIATDHRVWGPNKLI